MIKAVLYARYSSDMQREESIDAQFRAGREYCKRKEYIIVKGYRDEAFSGTNDQRPAFQELMADAKDKKFDVVVFHKIDRYSRNEYDYYFSKFKLKKYGVRIEYVAQHIDDSPEGAMMEAVLIGMSAYYSRNLSKEVTKGQRENAYKGLFNGGTPPLGYKIVDKKYVIDEYEAQAVRLIFDLYLKGYGYIAICNELNRQGYKTKAGRRFGKNSLYEILRNVRYIGTHTLGKTRPDTAGKRNTHGKPAPDMVVVENIIPPIISKNDFGKVAEKMEHNRHKYTAYKAKYTYLLSGLVHCGESGALMQGKTIVNRPDRVYQYYYCGAQNRQGKVACSSNRINLVDLEDLIVKN